MYNYRDTQILSAMSCVAKKDAAYRDVPQTAARRAAPKRNPTKWLRFGKEEQRNERALTFEKSRSKRYDACSDVVPVGGLGPPRCRQRRILSPLRLPIPSHRHF